MGLFDKVREQFRVNLRDFVLGPGVVDTWDTYHGHSPETYSPEEYGNYIATSNGVYACVTLRAELLASLPLRLYKTVSNGDRVEVESGQLYDLLHQVNPFWTLDRLLTMTEMSLGLWGQAYWFLERGETGTAPPREIWWGRPDKVRVLTDANDYVKGFVYEPANGTKPLEYSPQEVIWFPVPNPLDEFSGLSPLAAARLAADVASAAMKSNYHLFSQGMQMGAVVYPKAGQTWTKDQADDMLEKLEKRFQGVDKAHKWGVFRQEIQIEDVGITPKDAEFLGALKWSLEDICRAYKVPLDLIGGQRTYENVQAAERAVWARAVKPRSRFIASELTEKLLPMFPPGQADLAEFDLSEVEALQEAEADRWARSNEQLQRGVLTINEWRDDQGKDAVDWGDVAWLPMSLVPVESSELPEPSPALLPPPEPEPEDGEEELEPERTHTRQQGSVEYGSAQHELLWRRFVRRTDRYEVMIGNEVAGLFERLRDSVISRLNARTVTHLQEPIDKHDAEMRAIEDLLLEPFDMAKWIKIFREAMLPIFRFVFGDSGEASLEDLGISMAFDLENPQVLRFLERQTQRFAEPVLDTTWKKLKLELAKGIDDGEGIPQLADRVEQVMASRIRSSKETIARTETIRASNGGAIEGWRQSDVVGGKQWLSALDERTRTAPFDHVGAHGEKVELGALFQNTGEPIDMPGGDGSAGNTINCRCTMTPVLKADMEVISA